MESISEAIDERYRWVSRVHRKRKRRDVLEVIGRNLRKYCENSSLAGFRYLVEPNRPWIERVVWTILHMSTLCLLAILVRSAYVEYLEVPVVTVVDSDNYPSHKLEFPGIAICNINRISRKAAIKLANEIISANITDWDLIDVLRLVKKLGDLYEQGDDLEVADEKYLDQLLRQYYKDGYDVTTVMKDLTPNCEDALSSCRFQGEARNCSDIFVFRKTQHGFCCTFNYARESDDIANTDEIKKEEPRQPYNISSLGKTNGLSLVMEPFVEDYYYPILPMTGWKVTIFNARDYPDNGSGSVSEALLSPATETSIVLDVTSFYSTDEIRNVAIKKRKCIFQNELPVLYTGYTYSDCLVDCRAAAIWEICKCRPFYLPRRGNNQYNQHICNTRDSVCLFKYREVFWTVLSDKVDDPNEKAQNYKLSLQTSEKCSRCYPACNDVRYYLHSSGYYLEKDIYQTELLDNVRLDNQSILHIFFAKHGSVRLKQEAAYYWYELLSNIGGICGVFVGFSLISVVEFLYFVLRMLLELSRGKAIMRTRKMTMGKTLGRMREKTEMNEKRFTGTLYWNEFLTHSNINTKHDGLIQAWTH